MTGQPRFSIIPGWIVTDPRLKGRDLQVLCLLGRHTDKQGWCRRSQVKMAGQLNCARSTVQASLDRLADIGVVEKHLDESLPDGRDSAHFYRVIFDREPPSGYAFDAWQDDENEENIPVLDASDIDPPADISAPPADAGAAPPADSGSAPINAPYLTTPSERIEREGARESEEKESPPDNAKAIERAFKLWYPTWDGYDLDSEANARKAWFALTAKERADAADRSAEYQRKWKSNGKTYKLASSTYLTEKRWKKLPPKPVEPAKAEIAAPMGKAWMMIRFSTFHSPQRPMPKPIAFVQADLDAGGERAENAQIARNEMYGWPKIHEMNERLRNREPLRAAADMVAMSSDFVSVEITGPVGQAWKRLHRRHLLPWLPYEPKYAYFPPIDAGEPDLDRAVAVAFWGLKERIEGDASAAAQ